MALAQDLFLQSHGIGAPTQTTAQLLVSCPLQHPGREAVFRALTAVPHLGPQAAHAIVGAFASLGPLMAAYADPGRYKLPPCLPETPGSVWLAGRAVIADQTSDMVSTLDHLTRPMEALIFAVPGWPQNAYSPSDDADDRHMLRPGQRSRSWT